MSAAHVAELLQTKQRVAHEQGDKFPAWALDQLGIETMFANRVAMGKGLAALISKPNVYADFSAQTFLIYPRELSEVLRNWLEAYPDKILFGTDAFSFGPEVDWRKLPGSQTRRRGRHSHWR
jgi:hypothetical protein